MSETSTSEEDWRLRELKDYFAHAATCLNVKKVNYYIWFRVALHFMGTKNITKACNTEKEPTHVSMTALKCFVVSVFICIDLNIIQTLPSCLRDLKRLDKSLSCASVFHLSL